MSKNTIQRASCKRGLKQNHRVKLNGRLGEKDEADLTNRERLFASEFATTLNATQSAIKAGYSERSAHVLAHRLLKKANVAKAIQQTQVRRLTRADITAEKVLIELAAVGFSPTDSNLPKPSDKIAALTTLARHLQLLPTKVEVSGAQGGPINVLSMNVTARDLAEAKRLVESFRHSTPLIEGKLSGDEN